MSLMKIKRTTPYRVVIYLLNTVKRILPLKPAAEREYERENKKDKRQNHFANPVVDLAVKEFKRQGGVFGGFSLAESSVRCFLYHLLATKQGGYHICEFGGGQSTLFWNVVTRRVDLCVTTYEHDPEWATLLKGRIDSKNINVVSCDLMQVDDQSRNEMFDNPSSAKHIWIRSRSRVSQEQYKNPFLRNGFYDIPSNHFPRGKLDALIVDGPHGSGRSICFPLFHDYLERGTLVLLDDYHHYPFLEDLGRLFQYEILEERRYAKSNKGWVVVRIISKLQRNESNEALP